MAQNFILILTISFLTACGQITGIPRLPTAPPEKVIPSNPGTPQIPLPPILPSVLCQDHNASNFGSASPCSCSTLFTLSSNGQYCIEKQVYTKINLMTESMANVQFDVYTAGTIIIDSSDVDPSWSRSLPMRIKGRGHSTWEFPKKPYKVKLDSSNSIMGMPKDKEWVFLANYSDKTLMRVIIANEMGRRLNMAYTPRQRTVDLSLNYLNIGTYLLTEQIKIGTNRVNAVSTDITGGYLIELDQHTDNEFFFSTSRGIPYAIKEPEEPTSEQQAYISNYIQLAEDSLRASNFADPINGYAKYIDVDSFVDWYIVNEILKNSDAGNYSSIYFHKSSGEKLKMGPLWDFDLAIGNINYTDAEYAEGWWIRSESPWFRRLFLDPAFQAKVKSRWNSLDDRRLSLPYLLAFIDQKAEALRLTQQENFSIWDILSTYVWPNRVVTGSYQGEVNELKDWLTLRMTWMDEQINDN